VEAAVPLRNLETGLPHFDNAIGGQELVDRTSWNMLQKLHMCFASGIDHDNLGVGLLITSRCPKCTTKLNHYSWY
jgi:hypothetical protein